MLQERTLKAGMRPMIRRIIHWAFASTLLFLTLFVTWHAADSAHVDHDQSCSICSVASVLRAGTAPDPAVAITPVPKIHAILLGESSEQVFSSALTSNRIRSRAPPVA
mgnify:CR=1 FL=1